MNNNDFFALLSNETRRRILNSLAKEPKYLFQLSNELHKPRQSLNKHLKCLLDAGWIAKVNVDENINPDEEKIGPNRNYFRIAKNLKAQITLSEHALDINIMEIELNQDKNFSKPLDINKHINTFAAGVNEILTDFMKDDSVDYSLKIKKLGETLTQLNKIESFLLSRKITLTGNINETISMTLSGDAHRKDREIAYKIFSSSKPLNANVLTDEIQLKPEELVKTLKLLEDNNLLPSSKKNEIFDLIKAINEKKHSEVIIN